MGSLEISCAGGSYTKRPPWPPREGTFALNARRNISWQLGLSTLPSLSRAYNDARTRLLYAVSRFAELCGLKGMSDLQDRHAPQHDQEFVHEQRRS
jgi:hypothetical protein